jgi:CRP-like cAMP-binding protein
MAQVNFWTRLPQSAARLIEQNTHIKTYKKGAVIYSSGEKPIGIYFIKKGLVGLVTQTPKGSEHLLRLFSENNFFGHRALFAHQSYYGNAVCLEQSEIGLVPSRIVETILETYPEASRLIIETLALELGQAENQRLKIADQEVLQRLASSLIYLKEVHPDHKWTRSEIANFCASTGPTVIRGLAVLEKQGLISQKGRAIEIIDRNKLLQFANDSYLS